MGSDEIAVPSLDFLAGRTDLEVRAVFTQPDRRSGRGKKLQPNAIKRWALGRDIEVRQPDRPGDVEITWLKANRIDLILVMAYGHILPRHLIDSVPLGTYNLHASLLPKYRGASPIETAIAEGETETGVALMKMVRRLDAGPVVDLESFLVDRLETGGSAREKIAAASVSLLERNLSGMLDGTAVAEKQDEKAASYTRKLVKEDGVVDFRLSARAIARRINGLNPWPGCAVTIAGQQVKIGLADFGAGEDSAEPGTILTEPESGEMKIATGEGVLLLLELQRPGGRMMKTADFLRGFPVEQGMVLDSVPVPPLVSDEPFPYRRVERTVFSRPAVEVSGDRDKIEGMELRGIHHVTAVTARAAANHDFYTGTLGMRLVKKTVNQDDTRAYHLFYADAEGSPGTDLTFFDWPAKREERGARSISRTGLRVASEQSLEWWAGRLRESGIGAGVIRGGDGRAQIPFEDPEGQRLALVVDPGGAGIPWEGSPVPVEHQIRGLGPLVLTVSEIAPTDLVLTELLGMRKTGEYCWSESDPAMVSIYEMGEGGAGAELHLKEEPESPAARIGAGAVHHLALRVPDATTLVLWDRHLRAAGVSTSGLIDRFYFQSVYFHDVSGILFELATDGPGFSVDEPMESLGGRLSLPPFLEGRRAEIESRLKPL